MKKGKECVVFLKHNRKKMVRGFDCLSACVTYAESRLGNDLDEYKVFFLFGERFVFLLEEDECSLCSNSHRLMEEKLESFGIAGGDFSLETTEPERYIEKCLQEGKFLAVSLRTRFLSYRNIFMNNGMAKHYLCILKYNPETRQVYVYDGYIPNENNIPFEGWLNVGDILPAWESTKYRHLLWEKSQMHLDNLDELVYKSVKKTLINYLNPQKNIICGEDAVYKWLERLGEHDDVDYLLFQLKINGFLTIKYYLLDYFELELGLHEMMEKYKKILDKWGQICLLLFHMKLKKKSEKLDKVRKMSVELLKEERVLLGEVFDNVLLMEKENRIPGVKFGE